MTDPGTQQAEPPTEPTEPPPGPPSLPPRRGEPRRNTVILGLALALIAALAVAAIAGVRLRDERDRVAELDDQVAQLKHQVDDLRANVSGSGSSDPLGRIAAAVAKLRGLSFTTTVKPELLSASELSARVTQIFKHDNTRASLNGTAAVLGVYGLLPTHYDLYKEMLALQGEQVAGFYDEKTKRLVVGARSARNPTPFDRIILAHEYTHALTDQHFGLKALDRLQKAGQDDAAEAYLSLAEGDATLLMQLYEADVLTAQEQAQAVQEARAGPTSIFDAAPAYLQDVLQFPYVQGLSFVQTLHDQGGFDLVNQAYRDPPVSTEQIMHPTRYLAARDDPTPVSMPNVVRALGTGWREVDSGGVGEADVLEILDRGGGIGLSTHDAGTAADGWDGGAYAGFSSSGGTLVATFTAWDSERQAREAADAFSSWLRLRYPNGSSFDPSNGDGWSSRAGSGEVERVGTRVLVLLGPNRGDLDRARSAFSGF